jgi:hypothetical protein
VTDDACGLDAEVVHQQPDPIGVRRCRERRESGPVASAESEEVYDHEPVAFRHFPHDAVPEMRRGRESVQEDDRLARAARAGGVVVESRDTQVHKLAAHRGKMGAARRCDKRDRVRGSPAHQAAPAEIAARNLEFALAFRHENGILSNWRIVACHRVADRIV